MNQQFREILYPYLELFERRFADEGIAPSVRPIQAAFLFSEYAITAIEGEDKSDYDHPWFAFVYGEVEDWYRNRYGDAFLNASSDKLDGLVLIFNHPYRIEIPATTLGDREPPDKVWMKFPGALEPSEDPFAWVVGPPKFDSMSSAERQTTENDLRIAVNCSRRLYLNLMSADIANDESCAFSKGLLGHLSKAIDDICRLSLSSRCAAVWEFHMAMEKLIKMVIQDCGDDPPRIHPIADLVGIAERLGVSRVSDDILKRIPSSDTAIAYRYNQTPPPSLEYVRAHYHNTLEFIVHYSSQLKRQYRFEDAKFLIRAPPWLDGRARPALRESDPPIQSPGHTRFVACVLIAFA